MDKQDRKRISDLLRNKNSHLQINYKIHSYSSYINSYSPSNILINCPTDPYSRWSTNTNDHRQFIILEYSPSIVSTIQFGKFSKIHVCNIKEMKISVSYDKINWKEVFYGGLKNDTISETHNLTYYDDDYIISKYLKIEPLAAWGMNFNYSIWYVKLKGVTSNEFPREMEHRKKEEEIRMLRKLLRKYNHNVEEGSFIEEYINSGLYEELEEYIRIMDPSVFDNYISKSPYIGTWTEIKKEGDWPCARGGHQMVCKEEGIYLYGGWNGSDELGDMWIYNGKWECIQPINIIKDNTNNIIRDNTNNIIRDNTNNNIIRDNTNNNIIRDNTNNIIRENTNNIIRDNTNNIIRDNTNNIIRDCPGKRSCHKMCTNGTDIFLIGKYIPDLTIIHNTIITDNMNNDNIDNLIIDNDNILNRNNNTNSTIENTNLTLEENDSNIMIIEEEDSLTELWVYKDKWEKYPVTGSLPPNLFDHYLVYNKGCIFMFGGKTTSYDDSYGGLYKIDLINKSSTKLLDSTDQPIDSPFLKGRLGHVLLYLDSKEYPNTLAVLGGQRGKEYFKYISFYSLDTKTVYEKVNYPVIADGRIIQRSLVYKDDILVLFSYGKDKESKIDILKLYSYSLIHKKWTLINVEFPFKARTAHQFVLYKDNFYLFGGNVIDNRQNDFWKLSLTKLSREEVRRMAIITVRKHKFNSLYKKDVKKGLEYLRTKVKELVVDTNTQIIFENTCSEIFEEEGDGIDEISQYFI